MNAYLKCTWREHYRNQIKWNRNVWISLLFQSSVINAGYFTEDWDLHILVNNAGVSMCPQELTGDNFEMQFQTNYLGKCAKLPVQPLNI